jgi:hypothetical protein
VPASSRPDARQGGLGDAAIAQQRQNRVVIGGNRKLDAPFFVELFVERDNGLEYLVLCFKE